MSAVEVLKALADQTRLRMVSLLNETEVLCSCEIEAILGINQSNASRHLGRLRQAGMVTAEKDGHWVHYSRADSSYAPILSGLLERARVEDPTFEADLERLRAYQKSRYSCETIGDWNGEAFRRPS